MRKYLPGSLFFLLLAMTALQAQHPDSIRHRVIFIGDAGAIGKQQEAVIAHAAGSIIRDKTTVMFLGDNIYESGMPLPGSSDEDEAAKILRSQYQPIRSKGAPVYFVPGCHDWDKMGKNGLARIKSQWKFLDQQNDPLLKLVPPNGCPDPVELPVDDRLTIIAFDSEWWLFPFTKDNPDAECDCMAKDEVLARFQDLLYKNRYKIILLASHHPFQSYGIHGGHFSLKDHLFPLTAINPVLLIPLPLVGSLYPIMRGSFVSPEDLSHPLYRNMVRKIDKVFDSFPNLVHVAGHEHCLQLIKDKQVQVVSGGGSGGSHIIKRKPVLFASSTEGYVTVDLLEDNSTRITYYNLKERNIQPVYTYDQPFTDVKFKEELSYSSITTDSVEVRAYPKYNDVSKFHRAIFGENFRKEWAALTELPVIRISQIQGGLTPVKRGGGHQTISLRLKDNEGREWVLRSIEKDPEVLLPEALRGTFARDVIQDAISSQHPYSSLTVPVLAQAVNVPFAHPLIGYVAPDRNLGIYQKTFGNRVCLLEEREPLGNSDNTAKMLERLNEDNDNGIDSIAFLRARLLDFYLGDWDRHEDQWRWHDTKKGGGKKYIAVPRDRDQTLYRNEGLLPSVASTRGIAPFLKGFRSKYVHGNEFFINGRNLDGRFLSQLNHEQWMKITHEFIASLSDSVLEASLAKLPRSSYRLRHDELLEKMKNRRENLAAASENYYFFINKRVDLRVSDKNELIAITDELGGTAVTIHKISKEGKVKDQLFSRTFEPSVTKEIRIYTGKGNDSIVVNTAGTGTKLRIIGGEGNKTYNVINSRKKIVLYERESNVIMTGKTGRIRKHLSNDSANLAILPTNRYNVTVPLITVGFNRDDGLLLGLSLKHTHQGFRKLPYASTHQFSVSHAFSTSAFRIGYRSEWLGRKNNPDFLLQAIAKAPDNTQNFFGRGNETPFNKTGNYKRYYRTRFNLYQLDPALRWKGEKGSSFMIGPSVQFYHLDPDENKGRFIESTSLVGSYDSSTLTRDRVHLGAILNFFNDKRNSNTFPTWGSTINIRLLAYTGLNDYSKSFMQVNPEITIYRPLNAGQTIVLAERIGGGITVGNSAFYQSEFIGGHENLLGYRQYRFAGQHSMYNNLELRIRLADFASYILPGQFGITGFFDVGRVWEKRDISGKWHTGVGGGCYFAPAQLVVLQLVAGHSNEGWYPYFTMGFRF